MSTRKQSSSTTTPDSNQNYKWYDYENDQIKSSCFSDGIGNQQEAKKEYRNYLADLITADYQGAR